MLLILQNSYDFFLLGQPIYQGYYTVHDMEYSTIGYAPLENSGKSVPEKSTIPETMMVPTPPKPFMEEYGPIIYVALVAIFGFFVILPICEYWWDLDNPDDEVYFIIVFSVYAVWMLAIYVFLLVPWLGLPWISTAETESMLGFAVPLVAGLHLAKRSKAASQKTTLK